MSGSIFQLLVRTGDAIQIGQEVLVLESMKMELPLESPVGGVVAELLVVVEEAVEEGQTLLRVETAD